MRTYVDRLNNILTTISNSINSEDWKKVVDNYVDYNEYDTLAKQNKELTEEVLLSLRSVNWK